jgi:hypothetical protein
MGRAFDTETLMAAFYEELREKQEAHSTTVFALDQLRGIAEIPDLPNITEGGSQGLLIASAVQDLSLVKDRWRVAGDGFLTLFQDVLVYPGICHGEMLEAVSRLMGDYDARQLGESHQYGGSQPGWSESWSTHRQRKVTPDQVSIGPDPSNPDLIWHLSGQGPGTLGRRPIGVPRRGCRCSRAPWSPRSAATT